MATKLGEMLGSRINHRDLISAAVSSHLSEIVSTLQRLGVRSTPKGKQRPRKFDRLAWEALEAAEKVCGLPKVVLLRLSVPSGQGGRDPSRSPGVPG